MGFVRKKTPKNTKFSSKMDWRDILAFYKTLCKIITMAQLALCWVILIGDRIRPLRYIHKDQIERNI
ncbi:phage integrase [Bartonella tribocorum]|uniref:Integrase protein n=1 Tax=Bartonella tribocorum (strain DSM 28219 / CCUG 45778 / CIP 105476 / IBS 506) TaxID=382640 RepID=A9IM22_BART1|nr:putative integrase protein [Bartonella tribocorum CIP 105476]CDO47817.1 phage integrase [Bartonella tribocorum]